MANKKFAKTQEYADAAKTISQNLTALMKREGYTNESLAEETGISLASVAKYTSGKTCPNIEYLMRMADTFGCSVDELIGRKPLDVDAAHALKSNVTKHMIDTYLKGADLSVLRYPNGKAVSIRLDNRVLPVLPTYPYNLVQDIVAPFSTSNAAIVRAMSRISLPLSKDQERGLEEALDSLDYRERKIILYRYQDGFNLDEVGRIYNITRERVRQIEGVALRKLRQVPNINLIRYGYRGSGVLQRNKRLKKQELYLRAQTKKLEEYEDLLKAKGVALNESAKAAKLPELPDYPSSAPAHTVGDITIDELGLSIRAYHVLKRRGFDTANDVFDFIADRGFQEFMLTRNLGKKTLDEIIKKIYDKTGINITNIDAKVKETDVDGVIKDEENLYTITESAESKEAC